MNMFTERLQVLIDHDQRTRLEATAQARGTSVATVVREAIDLALPAGSEGRRSAARALLAAEPMAVGDPDDIRDELDDLRGRHG